jgi:hypothetical protein
MSVPDKDYSNTIVYKITCKDPNIQDVYVGHTVNFVQRKKSHQLSCINSKNPSHNCKVYKVIRNNGGWDNWNMGIIAFYDCKDLNEARQKEQEHFVALNATMNSVEPFPSKSVNRVKRVNRVNCVKCINCVKRVRPVGRNTMMPNGKNRGSYTCEICDFRCSYKSNYDIHISTRKHQTMVKNEGLLVAAAADHSTAHTAIPSNTCRYCNKRYAHLSALSRHKRTCPMMNQNISEPVSNNLSQINTDDDFFPDENIKITSTELQNMITDTQFCKKMMFELIKTNNHLQEQILELMKNSQTHTPAPAPSPPPVPAPSSNTTTNPFNMNRFLNEKCKDAMNMTDFVNSIQLNLTDLENVERDGYVKGMSHIIIDNLQKMDVCERPVHCSDAKRETLYVRVDNQWERDGPRHPKMANAILALEKKNEVLIEEWANQHPNSINDGTRENKRYLKISNAISLGNIAKVIKRVAKNVTIDKDPQPQHPADTA